MKKCLKKAQISVTQNLVCKTLKTLALTIFLIFFFVLMKDIWMKYSAKMTTFGIRYYKHDEARKVLPSFSFCPLPGKHCYLILEFINIWLLFKKISKQNFTTWNSKQLLVVYFLPPNSLACISIFVLCCIIFGNILPIWTTVLDLS